MHMLHATNTCIHTPASYYIYIYIYILAKFIKFPKLLSSHIITDNSISSYGQQCFPK